MSRSRRPAESDPMDLLLDTVSNVFGGVMFLTLLAALLVISRGGDALTPSSKAASVPSATDLRMAELELSRTIESMQLENSELNFLLEAQARTLAQMVPSSDTEQKIGELDRLRIQMKSKEVEIQQTNQAIATQESLLNSTAGSLDTLELQRDQWRTKIDEQRLALKKMAEKSTRKITFSLLRDTTTPGIPILLRYGKVYRLYNDPIMNRVNTRDIEEIAKESFLPRRDGGNLAAENSVKLLVTELLEDYPPDRYHVTIAVWDDSFANFNLLRNQLVAAGYSYRTLPCTDETILVLREGGDQLVQ